MNCATPRHARHGSRASSSRSPPRPAPRASCSARSAPTTSPRRPRRRATSSAAAKCACRMVRCARVGEHQVVVHLHTDVDVELTVIIVAEEQGYGSTRTLERSPWPVRSVRATTGRLRSRRRRTPPHSVEAEQAVIGGLLIDAHAWDQVGDSVVAEDFYRPDHRLIFEAIAELIAAASPPTWSRSPSSSSAAASSNAGGLAYLGTLARDTPRPPMCAPMRRSCASARCCGR